MFISKEQLEKLDKVYDEVFQRKNLHMFYAEFFPFSPPAPSSRIEGLDKAIENITTELDAIKKYLKIEKIKIKINKTIMKKIKKGK